MQHRSGALATIALLLGAQGVCAAEPVDYQRDVLPIFEKHCYQCHDGRKQTSGFRLDIHSRALRGGDSGDPAIVPGKSGDSPLVARVSSTDPDEVMPPKDEGKPLSADQIALLRRWVDEGAVWPEKLANEDRLSATHWAFIAPKRPELPAVKNAAWPRTPIDHFVLANLDTERLKPSAEADRVTQLRRLSLDLVGLTPTVEELGAFLVDSSPDAYEKAVERLLASPHYGERWGRYWLDAARYADSDGFEKDKPRRVWFYRDWVINALNRDLPYDQFVIEQIAGDLLPGATQDQRVATGFLRNSMINEEGGIDPEQFRMEAMFDRMDTIGKSILGITIQCAQCHNHKYDPLTQEEYYRMFAFLNDSHEANVAVYTPGEQMQRAEMFRKISAIEADLKERNPDWRERMAAWEEGVAGDQPEWKVLTGFEIDDTAANGQKFFPQPDGSLLALGYAPPKNRLMLKVKTDAYPINAFRLELMTDPELPLGGPGRSIYGTAALSEFEVEAASASDPSKTQKVKFASATADINPPETPVLPMYDDRSGRRRVIGPIGYAIDGDTTTGWATDTDPGRRNQPRKAVFNLEKPIDVKGETILTIYLNQSHGGWNGNDNQNHNLGRFRLSVTSAKGAVADPLPAGVREILDIPVERRTPRQIDAVFSYWRTTVPEWHDADERIEALWKSHPEGSAQLVLMDLDKARETHVLQRGDFLKPDREVSPGVPEFLHPLAKDAEVNRLTFARWLVDRKSPTTARAIVNRVWQAYFGTGLVNTSEDLGVRCEAPSNPELLDWLAVEFMDSGWSLKHLHRLIVNSATYRQSSHVTSELVSRDPDNRLLARGPRFRLDAEAVRDVALEAGGLLNSKVGGESVFPPMPEYLLKPPVSYGDKTWTASPVPDRYRRSMYVFRFRTSLYPAFQTFDAPTAEFSCVRRSRSNTPLQALVTLNEPEWMECARGLAQRILEDGGQTNESRLEYAFRRCVSREPTDAEKHELLQFYEKQKTRISEGWLNAWHLASSDDGQAKAAETSEQHSKKPVRAKSDESTKEASRDEAPHVAQVAKVATKTIPSVPHGSTPTELAAWTCVARVLLNLDETITKE